MTQIKPKVNNQSAFCHEPPHRYEIPGTYMVTAATYEKLHLFKSSAKLDLLQDLLLHEANAQRWKLKAWAIFSNHYHFIGECIDNPESLPKLINDLHRKSATEVNRLDGAIGRNVWYQYRDTRISFRNSYFSRLNYVIQNPVKHGLVAVASNYKWCSAHWFEIYADAQYRKMVYGYKFEKLNVPDDF